MSDAELTGQVTVLVFGAQDTTASALARVFWVLAGGGDDSERGIGGNVEVQRKVRAEIKRAWAEGKYHIVTNEEGKEEKRLDTDVVMGLPWLDAVVKETLRVYPPVPFVRRVCTRDAEVPYIPFVPSPSPSPGSPPTSPSASPTASTTAEPGGSAEAGEVELLHLPKGTKLFLSIVGCNRSKEVWGEDAGVWRPERWLSSSESSSSLFEGGDGTGTGDGDRDGNGNGSGEGEGEGEGGEGTKGTKKPYSDRVKIPGAWNGMLTFLGGGRSCVGSRFAIMEMSAWSFRLFLL
jgi:cytochrome P450